MGSGTTAAVAHKMGRKYIGIEMGEHAVSHVVPRLQKVIDGEQGGISKALGWQGGGSFVFYQLGETIFDVYGNIHPKIKWDALASFIWFLETKTALAPRTNKSPLIGIHDNKAYYLLYNGILGDKKPNGGNVLTSIVFEDLPPFAGEKIIFGEACRMSEEKLNDLQISFRQIPYCLK